MVVGKLFEHDPAYIFQNPDKRILFAIPYEGECTLIGTTEIERHGKVGATRIDPCEIDSLCTQESRCFERATVDRWCAAHWPPVAAPADAGPLPMEEQAWS